MDRCINSLLSAGENVEIIIVNDGSKDRTGEIALEYQSKYPDIVRAINKENGGHGSGVNTGIALATGVYFKVVDSDDWLDPTALQKLMVRIKSFCMMELRNQEAVTPDLIVCNYVYDHLNEGTSHAINYRKVMHPETMYTWDTVGHFGLSQYLVMHTLIYRTEVLRKSGIKLPEHTFYVDNIYAYQPLPFTEHLYYMDIDLYHYFIGRDDQSVNESIMLTRIDQQILVTRLMSQSTNLSIVHFQHPKLANYMRRYVSMMFSITTVLLLLIDTEEAWQQRRELWDEMRDWDPKLYQRLHFGSMSMWTTLPGRTGRRVILAGYRLARMLYKFN
jgi:glycosyltransferase involved in cell wall biosynthesis